MVAQTPVYWPLILYFLAVAALVVAMVGVSWVLGERHRERATGVPYESGMTPTGSGWSRISADFYLVAMLFVIFDVESVFLFAWAVAARELGWAGYAAVAIFIGVLFAALAYLWRAGALNWGAAAAPPPRAGNGGAP